MASHATALSQTTVEFATSLLARSDLDGRARLIAREVARLLPGSAVIVYTPTTAGTDWISKALVGDMARPRGPIPQNQGVFARAKQKREPAVYQFAELARELYAHLDIRRNFASLAIVPLVQENTPVALVEIVSFEQPLELETLTQLEHVYESSALALSVAQRSDEERNAQLRTINRLT